VADMFLCPTGQSPFDAHWGPSLREYSPVVARTTINAGQILSGRASYVKGLLIHSRGGLNGRFCDNCQGALTSA
jgi:hypothetical protein